MEKKFRFKGNPNAAKVVYGAVIALLCITAIIIGIVAANNRKDPIPDPDENPPITDGGNENGDQTPPEDNTPEDKEPEKEKLTFISPVAGRVVKNHSLSIPVFSETLEAWRVHTGIDISTDEGADVFAAADGEVSRVYNDPMLGCTVEITHEGGIKTLYSNLEESGLPTVGTEVESGAKIGRIGDSSISELADEAHLHFEVVVAEASVNPLDYISDEAKRVSLGITENEAA